MLNSRLAEDWCLDTFSDGFDEIQSCPSTHCKKSEDFSDERAITEGPFIDHFKIGHIWYSEPLCYVVDKGETIEEEKIQFDEPQE